MGDRSGIEGPRGDSRPGSEPLLQPRFEVEPVSHH